jgi:hypothetical protein
MRCLVTIFLGADVDAERAPPDVSHAHELGEGPIDQSASWLRSTDQSLFAYEGVRLLALRFLADAMNAREHVDDEIVFEVHRVEALLGVRVHRMQVPNVSTFLGNGIDSLFHHLVVIGDGPRGAAVG